MQVVYISSAAGDDVVVLVSAGWSWLLSPCGVCVGAGGAEVAAGGGAGGAAPRNSHEYTYVRVCILDIA